MNSLRGAENSKPVDQVWGSMGSASGDLIPVVRRAMCFMEESLNERITLEKLAVRAACSRFHLARLFRATTGQSPMEFLSRLRVQRGKRLLEQGGSSICEIALGLGFCDQSHFSRTFRKHMGMCPRDYAAAWKGRRSSNRRAVVPIPQFDQFSKQLTSGQRS